MSKYSLAREKRTSRKNRDAGKFIIYTEGSITEPEYLRTWIDEYAKQKKINQVKAHYKFRIIPSSGETEPGKIVENILNDKRSYEDFDTLFVVFDEDDRSISGKNKTNFLNAIEKATKNNIKVICSNRSIELWALLHFEESAPVDECSSKLSNYMPEYHPSRNKRFDVQKMLVGNKQELAKERAKRLAQNNKDQGKNWYSRPSTNFYELIEAMEKKIQE